MRTLSHECDIGCYDKPRVHSGAGYYRVRRRVLPMRDPSLTALADQALEMWLDRSLHEQFAGVMTEPVPQYWADLIEDSAEARTQ